MPASSTSWPGVNASRTAVLRSATRATRFTDSASSGVDSSAVALAWLGSSVLVPRELAAEQPGRGLPPAALEADHPVAARAAVGPPSPGRASAIDTSAPDVSDRAVSARALAGTSTAADRSGRAGLHRSSRTASR